MDKVAEPLWEEFDTESVYIRDRLQFALKSEFFPGHPYSECSQEFYLFIPNSLQINQGTYTKDQFYLDETTLIRFKTPEFTFAQLLDLKDERSPLSQILMFCSGPNNEETQRKMSYELKLFANVVRSALRREVSVLIGLIESETPKISYDEINRKITQLTQEIKALHLLYDQAKDNFQKSWNDSHLYRQMLYIEEFISETITKYLTTLLECIRVERKEDLNISDNVLTEALLEEKMVSSYFIFSNGENKKGEIHENENILYRYSLLNKFVLDALHLNLNRTSLGQRYENWIGGISAAVAIFIYFLLFFWLGAIFIFNSLPFLMIMVIAYVLKDRIKEWVKSASYQYATKWFPDYTTTIKTPDGKKKLGVLKESFSFLDPSQISQELAHVRNVEYHAVLESVKRPESILYYKRVVQIIQPKEISDPRRNGLNIIFRFNINQFLVKASDPIETHLAIDQETKKLVSIRLPKVYHLNLIIRTTYRQKNETIKSDYKKLRLIVDKNGIRRIEQVTGVVSI